MLEDSTNVIILTDIYGITEALTCLKKSLTSDKVKVAVLDPYAGVIQHFADEALAYRAFSKECGHEAYVALALNAIEAARGKVILLGFSAGASAAWKAIDGLDHRLTHFIGFYPSQIRNHLEVKPLCPVTLVFPRQEVHFNVASIIATVSVSEQVCCIKTVYCHGFMNPLSTNFNNEAAIFFNQYIHQIHQLEDITGIRQKMNAPLN